MTALATAGAASATEPTAAETQPGPVSGGALSPLETTQPDTTLPLLRWDLLRRTIYRPPLVVWPDSLLAYDGRRVRMEGYLMPRYNAEEPGDLLLSALHPRSIFCGPSDMTALVEVTLPDFEAHPWPALPVEVTGTFHLSRSPGNLFWIYHLQATSWRRLHQWVQDFPGAEDERRREREEEEGP